MSLADVVTDQLNERFVALGFKKKSAGLVKNLSKDAVASVGLVRQSFPGVATLFPVVAVRFEAIYKLGLELGAYAESKSNATLSQPLEYLIPENDRRDYRFVADGDNGAELDRLIADVQQYGQPFFEAFNSIDAALESIRLDRVPRLNGRTQFLPLAHLLRGDAAEALRIAREYLASMDASRGTGRQYAQFVAKLTERCAPQ